MLVTTGETIPGREISEILGVVAGSTVRAKHVGKDILASFRNLVGGEIREYTEMLQEARIEAYRRLVDEASRMGADAVIGMRYMTTAISPGAAELLCYGTAVKLK